MGVDAAHSGIALAFQAKLLAVALHNIKTYAIARGLF
jgi:hypothetical protein